MNKLMINGLMGTATIYYRLQRCGIYQGFPLAELGA